MIRIQSNVGAALAQAGTMRQRLIQAIDEDVERTTLEAVNYSRQNAPILTSALKNSIMPIPAEQALMKRAYGSNLPYARRQEYEHASRAGFFRKAIWKARTDLRTRIQTSIQSL